MRWQKTKRRFAPIAGAVGLLVALGMLVTPMHADDGAADIDLNLGLEPDPAKGYQLLLNEPMSAPIMQQKDLSRLWKVWEPEERERAEKASSEERRRLTFERYGWVERPNDDSGLPLDYTPDGRGGLVTNCFTCHGGKVMGKTLPGVGNTHVDLTTLATDVRRLQALDRGADPSEVKDVTAPFNTPLNYHKGTTNAVLFAAVFAGLRDMQGRGAEYMKNPELMLHHDMNAPPWWNVKKKAKLYADSFAPKTPRQLMPFAMSPTFSDEKFRSFEPNFVHILAYINSLEPPEYPFEIDRELAEVGEGLFAETCAKCHGTYGADGEYPDEVVPIKEIGTDRRRFDSISLEQREQSNAGWLQYEGAYPLTLNPEGYIAPPLDGVWASAPYFHNGSVPTIYHVMNPSKRPTVWKRDENGYDEKRVGLQFEKYDAVPEGLNSRQRRMYYDTTHAGSSAAGHLFPDELLDAEEKIAVLEYLKTL